MHVVIMAEKSIETASVSNVLDRASPNDPTLFDCDHLAWHSMGRSFDLNARHDLEPFR
jgi:hypothetical protein